MRFRYVAAFLLLLMAVGCGGKDPVLQNTAADANGSWTASATAYQGAGTSPLDFTFTMTSSGMNGMMNFSNFQVGQNACFGPNSVMTGTMTMSGTVGGMMGGTGSATMSMDMWSNADKTGNHLHVDMTMASGMGSATGQYTLTGVTAGCVSSSGSFSMHRP